MTTLVWLNIISLVLYSEYYSGSLGQFLNGDCQNLYQILLVY